MSQASLLAVSIGNTRTRIGAFVDGKLAETATIENGSDEKLGEAIDSAYAPLRDNPDAAVLLAAVNTPQAERVTAALTERTGRAIHRIERDLPVPVGRQLDPEAIVGEDRLLNAAAAYDVLKQACVVVDAGTAITVDFVDGAGTFHGGAIAPGGQLMLDALQERTSLLPEVEFGRPEEALGHNTTEAMKTGVYHALRGMVHELVEKYAEVAGSFPLVIATGGDGALLFKEDERVDRVVPDLTLMGMALTWRTAVSQLKDDEANG